MASHYINPQDIWNLFYTIYDGNEYACAGAMGNMQAESGLYSDNAENLWNQQTGHTDEWLTQGINDGTITLNDFLQTSWYVNRYGFGYGLSQWTDSSRRTKLWEFTIDQGLDIDSQLGQFNYITWEWTNTDSYYNQFLSYMKSCTTVEQATRYYCSHYEVGSWNSNRLTYAQNWYDTFAGQQHDEYYIDLQTIGNGSATVSPSHAQTGEQITLDVTPAIGETLIDIEGRMMGSGQAIALSVQTGTQYFSMPNGNMYIIVTFSGTSPIPPPTHFTKMPLYLMLRQRRY